MCFQDWRIGRLVRAKQTDLALAIGAGFVLKPNQQRVGLTILADSAGNAIGIEVDSQNPAVILLDSIAQFQPYHMTLATHGDLPTRGIVIGSAVAATVNFAIIEYFAPEWLLSEGLSELMQHYKHK